MLSWPSHSVPACVSKVQMGSGFSLAAQPNPDIRAAGKWDFARIELGKNHVTRNTQPTGLLNNHWSRIYEDMQLVSTPSKG